MKSIVVIVVGVLFGMVWCVVGRSINKEGILMTPLNLIYRPISLRNIYEYDTLYRKRQRQMKRQVV